MRIQKPSKKPLPTIVGILCLVAALLGIRIVSGVGGGADEPTAVESVQETTSETTEADSTTDVVGAGDTAQADDVTGTAETDESTGAAETGDTAQADDVTGTAEAGNATEADGADAAKDSTMESPTKEAAKAEKPGENAESAETEKKQDVQAADVRFRNKKLLASHYEKHGKEMGFASAAEYEQAAAAVVGNPASLHKLEAEDGDDVYYLEESNEFVIVSKDGYIRTYFLPDAGKKYYDRQ